MPSNILGAIKSRRCPECGQKTIICRVQYPLIVETDMKGRVIFRDFNGKRKRPSNKDKAFLFDYATKSKFEAGHYECMACGWVSEPYKNTIQDY